MLKKTIASTLVALGMTQMLFQPNHIVGNEEISEFHCCESTVIPGEPLDPCLINPVYPYPATISLCDGWNIYAKGEFLYLSSIIDTYQNEVFNLSFDQSEVIQLLQRSPYQPGFKVSLGFDLCSVVLDATYLRYHAHNSTNYSARDNGGIVPNFANPVIFAQLFGLPFLNLQKARISMQLDLDLINVSLQKPVYMGKKIIMNLNYGVLGLWVGQKWNYRYTALSAPPQGIVTSDGQGIANHKSWAVRTNLGFKASALLGCNFKAIAGIDLSVQYASIYKVHSSSSIPLYPFPLGNNTIKSKRNIAHLQAYHSSEIGIGWGDYFACDRYHIDLSVTYNFLYQHIFDLGQAASFFGIDFLALNSFGVQGFAIGGRLDF